MKNLKKGIILTMLGLIGVIVLVGCGGPDKNTQSNIGIQKIKDRGILKVGVKEDVPKFGFKNPQTGEYEGMEIDMAKAMAKSILGDEKKIEFTPVTTKTRGPLLDNGEVDIVIATFVINEERLKSYNFSTPYYEDHEGLLVTKKGGIQSIKDLNNQNIAVPQAAVTKAIIEDAAKKAGIRVKCIEFGTYPECRAALLAGRVSAMSTDCSILLGYQDENTVLLPDRYSKMEYGIATKKDNKDLAKTIDDTVKQMKESGELKKIWDKWGLDAIK